MSLNKIFLIGNCGRDPEVRNNESGKWATFSLATTDRAYTTKSGTQVPERTEWHNIVVSHPGLVGVVEQYVRKGTKLFIEGKLRTRKYTARDNTERTVTEIHVSDMELLTPKEKTQQGAAERAPEAPQRQPQPDDDDELPF